MDGDGHGPAAHLPDRGDGTVGTTRLGEWMRMERYFISYSFRTGDGFGFGNTETLSNKKITDSDVIKKISKRIEKDYGLENDSVVIMNFQKFDS